MADQTSQTDGTAVPTPSPEMSVQDSAPVVETRPTKSAELMAIEESLGREFDSIDQAKESLRNLNSLVGDQTVAKQRKALEKLAKQANLTPSELLEVIETQDLNVPQAEETLVQSAPVRNLPDDTTKRLVRIETDNLVKDIPEASIVRDQLFAEALSTGRPAIEIWQAKFAPVIEAGKKLGAKKLQSNLEGQPTRAASTASEDSDTKIDFNGINPETGRRWTSSEMAKFLN